MGLSWLFKKRRGSDTASPLRAKNAHNSGLFWKKRRGSEWTPIYMLIVIIIALILIMTLVKPMMQHAAQVASESGAAAETAAKAGLFG